MRAVPNLGDNPPEVSGLATINFDGGGQSPGPVTAACIVKLSDGSVYKEVKVSTREPTTSLSTRP